MPVRPAAAVTVLPPTVEFAVTVAEAMPLLSVIAVAVLMPGPENVTVAPETGLFDKSVTVTESGLRNALPAGVHWPSPETLLTTTVGKETSRLGPHLFVSVAGLHGAGNGVLK